MTRARQQELSPELKARLKEALSGRFPPGWGKGKTLDEMVAETSRAALELAASLTQDELKESAERGSAPACPNTECGHGKKKRRTRFVEVRSRPVLTLNGAYEITRRCYECRYCGTAVVPFDEKLGIAGRERTVAVDRVIATVGCEIPFLPAKRVITDLTGLDVSDQTVREVTESAGRRAKGMLAEEAEWPRVATSASLPSA